MDDNVPSLYPPLRPSTSLVNLDYSADERAFRDEVRGWLRANLPPTMRDKVARYAHLTRDDLMRLAPDPRRQGLDRARLAG